MTLLIGLVCVVLAMGVVGTTVFRFRNGFDAQVSDYAWLGGFGLCAFALFLYGAILIQLQYRCEIDRHRDLVRAGWYCFGPRRVTRTRLSNCCGVVLVPRYLIDQKASRKSKELLVCLVKGKIGTIQKKVEKLFKILMNQPTSVEEARRVNSRKNAAAKMLVIVQTQTGDPESAIQWALDLANQLFLPLSCEGLRLCSLDHSKITKDEQNPVERRIDQQPRSGSMTRRALTGRQLHDADFP
jgi:hypothetical protein